jgi:hypothetical protein
MTSPWFRFREWLASRYRWAQYPRQRFIPQQARPPFFKHAIPWEARVLLSLLGGLAVLTGIMVLLAVVLLSWAFVTA